MNFDLFSDKINKIYDFLYNDDYKELYDVTSINLKTIKSSDIIIPRGKI